MDDYNFDDIIHDEVNEKIKSQIYKCMKVYGAEGTEDKLKDIYKNMPQLLDRWLEEYYKIIKERNNG